MGGHDGAYLVGQLEATGGLPAPVAQQPIGQLAEALSLGRVKLSPGNRSGFEDLAPIVGQPQSSVATTQRHPLDSIRFDVRSPATS